MLLSDLLSKYIRDEAHMIIVDRWYNRLYDFNRDGGDFPPNLMMWEVVYINITEVDGCIAIMVRKERKEGQI